MIVTAPNVQAQRVLNLPQPGTMVPVSPSFNPVLIKGIIIHPNDPFLFNFIIHPGDDALKDNKLKNEALKLIKYFMAALTVPEDEMWVNLSPYEKDRIIPKGFGNTEMGRDLLAQDYMLKQLTASLMYPEDEPGKDFWNRVYKKAQEKYSTTEIPMNTFNKVWIVPEKAVIYENSNSVFVVESHLKVMLEEDYLALEANEGNTKHGLGDATKEDLTQINAVSSEVIREIIIPEIEREVNEGRSFASLRQITNSVILATWYKQNVQGSILEQIYINKNKTVGIDTEDKEINQKIYERYVEAFKRGVYDFIKEDYDESTQEIIPRKYFSGGVEKDWRGKIESTGDNSQLSELNDLSMVRMRMGNVDSDSAMMSTAPEEMADPSFLYVDLRDENNEVLEDEYGIDLKAIYSQAIAKVSLNALAHSVTEFKDDLYLWSEEAKKLKIIAAPELRESIRNIYSKQLDEKAPEINLVKKRGLLRKVERSVFYITTQVISIDKKRPSLVDRLIRRVSQGIKKKVPFLVIDAEDLELLQKAGSNNNKLMDNVLNETAERWDNPGKKGWRTYGLARAVPSIVYGGNEGQAFGALLEKLPDASRKRWRGKFEQESRELGESLEMLKSLSFVKKEPEPENILDRLPELVREALKVTRIAKTEEMRIEDFSYMSLKDLESRLYSVARGMTVFPAPDTPDGWIRKINNEIGILSSVENQDKPSRLKAIFRQAALSFEPVDENQLLIQEVVDKINQQGLIPGLSVDDIYFIKDDHPLLQAGLPIVTKGGGKHVYIVDEKSGKDMDVYLVSVSDSDILLNHFLSLIHELTHGWSGHERTKLKKTPRHLMRILEDEPGNRSTYKIFNEGATEIFSEQIAVPLLLSDGPMMQKVRDEMFLNYKKRNPDDKTAALDKIEQLDEGQWLRIYRWFKSDHQFAFYADQAGIVNAVIQRYGEKVMTDYFFAQDYHLFQKAFSDRWPYINLLSNMVDGHEHYQLPGIDKLLWERSVLMLIQAIIESPHYDELDFFIDIIGKLVLNEGDVAKYQFDKIGLDSSDIFQKLIKNGWAREINPTKIKLTADLDTEKNRMAKIFGQDFSAILAILQHSHEKNQAKSTEAFKWIAEGAGIGMEGRVFNYFNLPIEQRRVVRQRILKNLKETLGEEDDAGDEAMIAIPGGIDLNPNNINIQTRGKGSKIQFPSDMVDIQMKSVDGLIPIIINVTPIVNIPALLE